MDSGPLTWIESIILGIVQGLTEFFPVSSDGHLAVARQLLNYHRDLLVFDVILHVGTLFSLLVVFHRETRDLLTATWIKMRESWTKRSIRPALSPDSRSREILYIWIVTFVTGLGGLAMEKLVQECGEDVRVAGIGFLISSAFLFASWLRKNNEKLPLELGWWFPLAVGLAQVSALLPGVSRSGMTIATALLFGVRRPEAGKFSFVAAIPIIALATVYEARHLIGRPMDQLEIMAMGVLAAFIVGLMAIKGLLAMLQYLSLLPFAIYTLVIGLWTLLYLS